MVEKTAKQLAKEVRNKKEEEKKAAARAAALQQASGQSASQQAGAPAKGPSVPPTSSNKPPSNQPSNRPPQNPRHQPDRNLGARGSGSSTTVVGFVRSFTGYAANQREWDARFEEQRSRLFRFMFGFWILISRSVASAKECIIFPFATIRWGVNAARNKLRRRKGEPELENPRPDFTNAAKSLVFLVGALAGWAILVSAYGKLWGVSVLPFAWIGHLTVAPAWMGATIGGWFTAGTGAIGAFHFTWAAIAAFATGPGVFLIIAAVGLFIFPKQIGKFFSNLLDKAPNLVDKGRSVGGDIDRAHAAMDSADDAFEGDDKKQDSKKKAKELRKKRKQFIEVHNKLVDSKDKLVEVERRYTTGLQDVAVVKQDKQSIKGYLKQVDKRIKELGKAIVKQEKKEASAPATGKAGTPTGQPKTGTGSNALQQSKNPSEVPQQGLPLIDPRASAPFAPLNGGIVGQPGEQQDQQKRVKKVRRDEREPAKGRNPVVRKRNMRGRRPDVKRRHSISGSLPNGRAKQ